MDTTFNQPTVFNLTINTDIQDSVLIDSSSITTLKITSACSEKQCNEKQCAQVKCTQVHCTQVHCTQVHCSQYRQCVYVYGYYTKCDCECGDSDTDGSCFIAGYLLTIHGYKLIEDLKVGDILVGPDGNHKIVGFSYSTLGQRNAVCPVGSDINTLLTEDHIIKDLDNNISVATKNYKHEFSRIKYDNRRHVYGTFYNKELEDKIRVENDKFKYHTLDKDTITINPIVESGNWVYIKGVKPVSALLAHKVSHG